jgi:thymidylate kinase
VTGWLGWQPIAGAGKRLVSGGAVIAVVGTDGSGKSTCTRELVDWLGRELAVRHAHVGKPPRSLLTLAAGLALKVARKVPIARRRRRQLTAHLELLRYVATARDRFRLCRRMRTFARGGGLAFCERYPVPECHAFSGPSVAQDRATVARSRVAARLRRIEARYYARIPAPDLLVVLEVDPDTAVARKTDEPAGYVRARAELMRSAIDWGRYTAIVIDATAPLRSVMAELRCRLWEAL